MKAVCVLALAAVAFAAPRIPQTGKQWTPDSLVNPDELGDEFEGDIKLPLPPMDRNGIVYESYRWPNGVMVYKFESGFTPSQISQVKAAMDNYVKLTDGCISFKERTTEANYVSMTRDESRGCFSYVGYTRRGPQQMNLPQWCLNSFGSLTHEMFHAFGFFHEQSRTDRDDYVTIKFENIRTGKEHNFNKYTSSLINGFGENYDYGSLMHYSAYAFSKNGQKTIVPKDASAVIGQRKNLSAVDLKKLKKMYKCPSK